LRALPASPRLKLKERPLRREQPGIRSTHQTRCISRFGPFLTEVAPRSES
jgi:hypothetical protein